MKRLLAIILSAVMALSVCACGGGAKTTETTTVAEEATTVEEETTGMEDNQKAEEQFAEIGEKTISSSGDFEMTLKNVSITDKINLDKNSDGFCKPLEDGAEAEYALAGKDIETFITFEFEYQFIGKSEVKDHFLDYGMPLLVYGDGYSFKEKYMVFSKTDNKDWMLLATDTSEEFRENYRLGNTFVNNKYEPLDDTIHYGVGIIDVPSKIKEDTEAPLTLQLPALGGVYKIR